jgi:pimeloyl-ACP methyl ester carboxylesterase
MQPGFKLLERGFKDTLVMIPGWAADYKIFSALDVGYNYLFTRNFSPFNFIPGLLRFLSQNRKRKISLFGCSLGGFLACEFGAQYPELTDRLILSGIRKRYEAALLKDVACQLKKNKRAFLYKFYLNCFSQEDKTGLLWFKQNLLKRYLENIKLEGLMQGLDYLSAAEIRPSLLRGIKKINIIHGEQDNIAPLKEALEIKSQLPEAQFVRLSGSGHIPFFHPQFKQGFSYG